MKKYINVMIIIVLSLHISALQKLEYEYPKNPIVADSLMEECFNKIVDIVNQALEGNNSRELSYEWIGTTMIIEDAIDCASKPLSEEQITILFNLIDKMRLNNLQYDQFKSHIFAPHIKRWGYDSRMEAILLEQINTDKPLAIARLVDAMKKAGLKNEQLKRRCTDMVSFRDVVTNKHRKTDDAGCDLSFSEDALKSAMEYLAEVYPDDKEVINAMIDGMIPADTLGYTVRWHLRYFMDNEHIKEYSKINRKLAANLLKERYDDVSDSGEKEIYHCALMITNRYISEDIYKKGIDILINSEDPVIREFMFEGIRYYLKNHLISKSIAEISIQRINEKLLNLKNALGINDDRITSDLLNSNNNNVKWKYNLINEFSEYYRMANDLSEKIH